MHPAFRYRLRFRKTGTARFLSHRDLLRLFERAGRRVGLPLAMTGGFNPHPRMSLAPALKLGMEGLDEALEIDLSSPADPACLPRAFNRTMPDGVAFASAEAVPPGRRAAVASCAYGVRLPPGAAECAAAAPAGAAVGIRPGGLEAEVVVDHGLANPPRLDDVLDAVFGEGSAGRLEAVRTRVEFAAPAGSAR